MTDDPHQKAADHIRAAQELYDIETTAAETAHDTARHHYEQAIRTYTEQTQAVLAERAAALDAITAELPQTLASVDLHRQEPKNEGPSQAT